MVDVLVRSPDQQKIAGFSIPATEPLPYSHPRLIRNEHVRTNYSLRFLLVAQSRYAKLTLRRAESCLRRAPYRDGPMDGDAFRASSLTSRSCKVWKTRQSRNPPTACAHSPPLATDVLADAVCGE
jgi:hypothetical protein